MASETDPFSAARRILEAGLATDAFAGAVAVILHRGAVAAELVLGDAQREPVARPMRDDTIFDLASLTKVLAGVTAALLLLDRGLWSLDEPVARAIPRFAAQGKERITLRHLLTHSSGLPAWAPLYLRAHAPDEALAILCEMELEAAPSARIDYSDMGMALVRFLVEQICAEDFAAFLTREIFAPLGMTDTCYLPNPALRSRCAATTQGNAHEVEMVAQRGTTFDRWRSHWLVGEVHDGNTHYALDGISSHAGLFATASDLARFAAMYLHEGASGTRQILSPGAVRLATRPQTAHPGPAYGLGWRIAGPRAITPEHPAPATMAFFLGDLASDRAYGHTGFTGTSLLIDPDRALAVILLTNAVQTDYTREGISYLRPRLHNAICAAVDGRSSA